MYCKKSICVTLACLLLAALCGCGKFTVITRDEQLAHISSTTMAEPDPTEDASHSTEGVASPSATQSSEPAQEQEETAASTGPAATEEVTPPSTDAPTEPAVTETQPATANTEPPVTEAETEPPVTEAETQPPATEPTQPEKDPYDISGHSIGSLEYELLALINAEREKAGAAPVYLDSYLCAIASVRAYECSISFSHTRPGGGSCFTVLGDYGYGYGTAGENILSYGSSSASAMVALWMDSQDHRENILCPDFTAAGFGIYRANGVIYVVNLFVG